MKLAESALRTFKNTPRLSVKAAAEQTEPTVTIVRGKGSKGSIRYYFSDLSILETRGRGRSHKIEVKA